MTITWPESREDYLKLATALAALVGGRPDVAARFYDFVAKDSQRIKGWGPWKGPVVADDYKALPGELVRPYKNNQTGATEYRLLKPLSPDNLIEHLRGKERLGVYVLDTNAHCKFLAADFDDHDGTLDPKGVWVEVRQFVDACEAHDWIVHVERSKSSKGYHVWLFFDAPVPADKARAVGKWLFEESRTLRDDDDFSTFDRFFPAQSQLSATSKGFGNLIGLPLFGQKDYAAGKTAWVNAKGKTITNPMTHTLDILESGRNAATRLDEFMSEWDLDPETVEVYEGGARDPDAVLGTPEQFEEMKNRCRFIKWVPDKANWPKGWPGASEPLWYAWISNLCRFKPALDWVHEVNSWHPKYSESETDRKFEHARISSGPQTCRMIKEEGFKHCPVGGCLLSNGNATKSPAGLASWAGGSGSSRKSRDRNVVVFPNAGAESAPPEKNADGQDIVPWRNNVPVNAETGLPWPKAMGNMEISTEGVKDSNSQFIALRPIWVDALTRNTLGQWGVSIKFFDLDWSPKTHAFPRERLHEQGGVLGRELAALGLPIVPGKEKWVSRYLVIQENHVAKRIMAAGRLGWFDAPNSPAVFVLPSQVLGNSDEEIVYQPNVLMNAEGQLHGQGKLKEWQNHIVEPCKGNPILMFSLMLGLAGPLLKLCNVENGGFHLYGVTTTGKTTAAQVAASVWGCAADPQEGPEVTSLRKWYTTGNALESLAEARNDTLLTLDEIGEADPYELGKIIYQLAGGLSKARANAAGGVREFRKWRVLFFSTGEKSSKQMMGQAGQTQKGGQQVRMADIPADNDSTGQRSVIVATGDEVPEKFVQNLKMACASYYGLAGPVFVAQLIIEAEKLTMVGLSGQLRSELHHLEARLTSDVPKEQMPPEGRRVIRRFALTALAGSRAAAYGIIDWSLKEIVDAICAVRDCWLADQGQEHSEIDRGLSYLRNQLITHNERFRWIDATVSNKGGAMRDILGFRVREYYLIHDAGLRELCGEHDTRAILRALKNGKHLSHDKGRLTKKSPRIEGFGNTRPNLYWISITFLGETPDGDTEEDKAVLRVSGETDNGGQASFVSEHILPDDDVPF